MYFQVKYYKEKYTKLDKTGIENDYDFWYIDARFQKVRSNANLIRTTIIRSGIYNDDARRNARKNYLNYRRT